MYKIIYDNRIIDVVKELRYVRYIPEFKKMIPTNIVSAQAICGSNNKTFYALQGVKIPAEKKHWKVVSFIQIQEEEYNQLLQQLNKNVLLYANKKELNLVRLTKIQELSNACNSAIVNGVSVLMDDGYYYQFRLTVEDQLNLVDLQQDINNGCSRVLYHATNNVCKLYTINEMQRVITTAQKHKKYHTTYFNLLKHCINNMYNIEDIEKIQYGDNIDNFNISDDLKKLLKEI